MLLIGGLGMAVVVVVAGVWAFAGGGEDDGGGTDRERTGSPDETEADQAPSYEPWQVGIYDEGTGCISYEIDQKLQWVCPGYESYDSLYSMYGPGGTNTGSWY